MRPMEVLHASWRPTLLPWASLLADCAPAVVDMSTSATAEGKLCFYREIGKNCPGWILVESGQPSGEADDFYDGGMILPFADHKGYGLGVVLEFLTGILLGDARELNWLILALDIATFREKDEYATDAEAFIKTLKETPAATGFVEVMALSEPEARVSAQRESERIPLPDATWQVIKEIAHKVGLSNLKNWTKSEKDDRNPIDHRREIRFASSPSVMATGKYMSWP